MLLSAFIFLVFLGVVFRIAGLAIYAAWKVSGVIISLVLLPLMLVLTIVFGLIRLALPVLVIAAVVVLIKRRRLIG